MGEVFGGKALPSLAGRKGRESPTTPVSLRGLRHVGNHLGLAARECGQPEHLYPNRHTVEITAIPGTVAISTVLFGVRRMKSGEPARSGTAKPQNHGRSRCPIHQAAAAVRVSAWGGSQPLQHAEGAPSLRRRSTSLDHRECRTAEEK